MERSPGRILVVDDEDAILKLVRTVLEKHKYEVVTSGTCDDALKRLDEDFFDVIVTDAVMPVQTGFDLVKSVREHPLFAKLPILMLTKKRDRKDVKKALDAGVSDYIVKPIDEHLLIDKVELCLKKGQGDRHIFELSLHGPETDAELGFKCRITSISESDITVESQLALTADMKFHFHSQFFENIGIDKPFLKLLKCETVRDKSTREILYYETKFTFIGVAEGDLKKIRSWLQKEAIRRKK